MAKQAAIVGPEPEKRNKKSAIIGAIIFANDLNHEEYMTHKSHVLIGWIIWLLFQERSRFSYFFVDDE